MTTSPAPISAADREKLAEQRRAYIDNPSNTWFYQLYFHAALEAIPSYEARVVELEAALAEAEAQAKMMVGLKNSMQDYVFEQRALLLASEARATALLEALGFYAALPNYELDGQGTTAVRMDRGRIAYAAINAAASNDRK